MRNFLGRLVEIETAIKVLREEIASVVVSNPNLSVPDRTDGRTEDVTPSYWTAAFTELKINGPRAVEPYVAFLPALGLGFAAGDSPACLVDQTPRTLLGGTSVRYGVNIWLQRPLEWLTLELGVPSHPKLTKGTFLFSWTATIHEAQNVQIGLWTKTGTGEGQRKVVSTTFMPGDTFTDILRLPAADTPDEAIEKILIEFTPQRFRSCILEDFRLLKVLPE